MSANSESIATRLRCTLRMMAESARNRPTVPFGLVASCCTTASSSRMRPTSLTNVESRRNRPSECASDATKRLIESTRASDCDARAPRAEAPVNAMPTDPRDSVSSSLRRCALAPMLDRLVFPLSNPSAPSVPAAPIPPLSSACAAGWPSDLSSTLLACSTRLVAEALLLVLHRASLRSMDGARDRAILASEQDTAEHDALPPGGRPAPSAA